MKNLPSKKSNFWLLDQKAKIRLFSLQFCSAFTLFNYFQNLLIRDMIYFNDFFGKSKLEFSISIIYGKHAFFWSHISFSLNEYLHRMKLMITMKQ